MFEELKKLAGSDQYPFHMPGHKRRMPENLRFDPYSIDITEIDGFDNIHEPSGIIRDLNRRLQERFGGDEAFILVNGSTAGILAALSCAAGPGDRIIMARNSHISAYNALFLRDIKAYFIFPEKIPGYRINGGIDPEKVRQSLEENKDVKAVFITSPTYEGIVSDVETISGICHEYNAALIVDSAHGAHAGLHKNFTDRYNFRSAVEAGADIVVESLHKTLPCFTQTAAVMIRHGYIDPDRFRWFYSAYQTTSPSYILMAGADRMLELLDEEGAERFKRLEERLDDFRRKIAGNDAIDCFGPSYIGKYGVYGFDPTKILLSCRGMTGKELYDRLRTGYHLQPEMASGDYVLLMTSIMDEKEGFQRLIKALEETGREVPAEGSPKTYEKSSGMKKRGAGFEEGSISGRYIFAYPPGIPLIIPGERFTKEIIDEIQSLEEKGIRITGI